MCKLLIAIATALCFAGPGAAAVRVAVVIGNGDYGLAPLPNAERDAELIARTFRGIGFTVIEFANVTSSQLDAMTAEIEEEMSDAEIGVVYFAGHAVQFEGVNHLLPVDLARLDEAEIDAKKLPLADIVTAATGGTQAGLRLFLIDACRNDPFAGAGARIEPGLRIEQLGTAETLIAYATAPGELALDGPPGSNGPYALALSRALSQRDVEISAVMRQVRGQVREATDTRQVPWVAGSVENEYWLNNSPRDERLEAVEGEDVTLDAVIWNFLQTTASEIDLRRFAQFFPRSRWRTDAVAQLGELGTVRDVGTTPPEPIATPAPALVINPGEPIPADLFRVERERLGDDPNGMAQLATPCDWLAADFADPQRVAPAVRNGMIDLTRAAQDCGYALLQDPENPRYMFQLGRVLQLARRHAWARHFYAEAARLGYSAALTNLGYIYEEGIDVEADYGLAMQYYRSAAELGNLRARTAIGVMFLRGLGVEKDEAEAVQWFRLASETGWVNAQNALGDRYATGEGVPLDPGTAVALYELAALNGQRNAMHNLGRMLLEGQGVEQDVELGVQWLERGIAAGSQFAPFTLARHLVATGVGERDPARVFKLLWLSCIRGYERAWLETAQLYERGSLVPRDPEKAYANAYRAELLKVSGGEELAVKLRGELPPETVDEIDRQVASERRFNGL